VIGPELDAPDESKTITVRRALTALGEEPGPDLPLVGDRSHDVVAAHANGLPCVGVLWGVGDEAELRRAGADPIVAAPADLPAALGLR
jgi:phosphoglycolate phosphatase